MANQNTLAENKPLTVPGNLSGTLAGMAASVVVGALANAGYLATVATFLGQPEAAVSLVVMVVVGGIANYAVTHIGAIGTLNSLYNLIPNTYAEYPANKTQFGSTNDGSSEE